MSEGKNVIVKLFGERNSGTNYLENLLQINFNIEILKGTEPIWIDRITKRFKITEIFTDLYFWLTESKSLGWKHRQLNSVDGRALNAELSKKVKFITITRNPYSWLLSLHNRPYHNLEKKELSFEQFLKEEWQVLNRETYKQRAYLNPIDMWNKKNWSYVNIQEEVEVLNMSYEALTINTEFELKNISNFLEVSFKSDGPKNYIKPTKPKDKGSKKDIHFYRRYHGEKIWLEELSDENIVFINKYLDKYLMDFFGYSLIQV